MLIDNRAMLALIEPLEQGLRALPMDNPDFAADALLVFASRIDEWRTELAISHPAPFRLALHLRALAERARTQAPIWAEPRPVAACADFLRRERG